MALPWAAVMLCGLCLNDFLPQAHKALKLPGGQGKTSSSLFLSRKHLFSIDFERRH